MAGSFITVPTTPVLVAADASVGGHSVTVTAVGGTIYYGSASVTTGTGTSIAAGSSVTFAASTWLISAGAVSAMIEDSRPAGSASLDPAVDATTIADKTLLVWDSASRRVQPFAQTPDLTTAGAAAIRLTYNPGATGWASTVAVRPLSLETTYIGTDHVANPLDVTYQGLNSSLTIGDASHAASASQVATRVAVIVANSGAATNEHANYFGYLRYDATATPGRGWFTDWSVHGAIATQQSKLDGITMFLNNYYNGSPSASPSANQWLVTAPGTGGGSTVGTLAATTYPVDVGLGIVGVSGTPDLVTTTKGFTIGVKVGGIGSGWPIGARSWIGTGFDVQDWDSWGLRVRARSSLAPAVAGQPAVGVDAGAGPVVIGDSAAQSTLSLLTVRSPTGVASDPLVQFFASGSTDKFSHIYSNASGSFKLFIAGATNDFVTGSVLGDGGIRLGTTAKKFLIGPSTQAVATFTQDSKLAFFGVTPVVKQSLVATATDPTTTMALVNDIRAKLVAYGLA